MSHTRRYDGTLIEGMLPFDGLPTFAVHKAVHAFRRLYDWRFTPTPDDIASRTDDELLALPAIGRATVAALRARFPYDPEARMERLVRRVDVLERQLQINNVPVPTDREVASAYEPQPIRRWRRGVV